METDRDNISVRVASFSYYLDTAAKDNSAPSIVYGKTKSHTSKPPLGTSFAQSSKDIIIPSFRVDSFSYNRKPKSEKSVFEAPGPVQDPTRAFSFLHEIPSREGEISVFGADKYFSMKLEYQTRAKHDYENQRPVDLIGIESKSKPRTPSLNSQSALLSSLHRSEKQKKPVRRRIFTGFNCQQGPCFEDNAVRIKDLVENDHPTVDKKKPIVSSLSDFEESRNSIEVFGWSETNSRSKGSYVAADMERKLSMLTWDAIIPMRSDRSHQASTTTAASSGICDDVASDASSDLFEIENVSGTLHPMLKSSKEDEDGDISSCMSPAYAPSEASIQWSIVTASAAADYSSAVLEYYSDEQVGFVNDNVNSNTRFNKARNVSEKEVQKCKSSSSSSGVSLLGCKSQKAVDVAENVCCNKKG